MLEDNEKSEEPISDMPTYSPQPRTAPAIAAPAAEPAIASPIELTAAAEAPAEADKPLTDEPPPPLDKASRTRLRQEPKKPRRLLI